MWFVNKACILFISAAVGFSIPGCQRAKNLRQKSVMVQKTSSDLPVHVSVIRDGRSSSIKFKSVHGEDMVQLFLVRRQPPERGGDVYLNESWNAPGSKALSAYDALIYLGRAEELLKEHYGDAELEKIVKETEMYNKMTVEELGLKYDDPVFGDRFETSNAIQLIGEFRGYLESQGK